MGKGLRIIHRDRFGDSTKFIEVIDNDIFSVGLYNDRKQLFQYTAEDVIRFIHNRTWIVAGTID